MQVSEIQLDLINKITNLKDEVMLNDLMQFVNFQLNTDVYKTNDLEKKDIAEAKEQIEKGEVIENKLFQSEITKWLEK